MRSIVERSLSSFTNMKGNKMRKKSVKRPPRIPVIEFHIVSYGLKAFCKRFFHPNGYHSEKFQSDRMGRLEELKRLRTVIKGDGLFKPYLVNTIGDAKENSVANVFSWVTPGLIQKLNACSQA
jgi:hypothetical protein